MKNNRGITIISLVVTIIVLLILAGVTLNYGTDSLKKAKVETLKTNMLLIKAKTLEYVEQANFKAGTDGQYEEDGTGNLKTEIASELKGEPVPDANTYSYLNINLQEGQYLYDITGELKNMGLKDVKIEEGEKYLVIYDIKNAKVEIYNTIGISRNGTNEYSLTQIQE